MDSCQVQKTSENLKTIGLSAGDGCFHLVLVALLSVCSDARLAPFLFRQLRFRVMGKMRGDSG